jgi:hypothetical protein
MFKRHWTFHLLPILSLLQVTGHLVSVYHLILLKPLPIIILIFLAERRTLQERFFFYGLLASLGGDLCLMSRDMYIFQFGTFLFFTCSCPIHQGICLRYFGVELEETKEKEAYNSPGFHHIYTNLAGV